MPGPVLRPEHRQSSTIPPTEPPSLHALRRRSSRSCSGASPALRGSSDSSPVPRQLRLLAFLPRPGIATATAGQMRSPRFHRDPFVRDVASDPGRATAPRITTPPHTIVVYASPRSSPSTPQHSLQGGRYPLPGPDLHRLDRASFAWRTNGWPMRSPADASPAPSRAQTHGLGPMWIATPSSHRTCTDYSLPVSGAQSGSAPPGSPRVLA